MLDSYEYRSKPKPSFAKVLIKTCISFVLCMCVLRVEEYISNEDIPKSGLLSVCFLGAFFYFIYAGVKYLDGDGEKEETLSEFFKNL